LFIGTPYDDATGVIATGVYTVTSTTGMTTGDVLRLNPADGADNGGGLTSATDYFVNVINATTFTIHPTAAEATAGLVGTAVKPVATTATDFINHTKRVNITTAAEAKTALELVKDAISQVAQDRAALGAVQSRLNFTNEQLSVTKENLSSAISRIADVDVAEEATQYARYQILVQSGTAMLQQANQLPQAALQLLRG
jgi:flagellin